MPARALYVKATAGICTPKSTSDCAPMKSVAARPIAGSSESRDLALCRAVLPERRTGATLGDMQDFTDLLDTGAATRGA